MAGQASQFSSSADRFAAHSPNLDFDRVNREAEILVKAMVNAAAADGRFDQSERSTILGSMGDLSQEEADFLNAAMSNPQDGAAFAQSVPKRMAQQVYTMSLTAIDLDSNPEAQYLHELARGLGIAPESANAIHRKLGAPEIYRA